MADVFPEKDGIACGEFAGGKAGLFYHIEKIGEIIEQAGGLNDLFFEFARPHLRVLSDRMQLTEMEAVVLARLFEVFGGQAISIGKLARILYCKPIRILQYMTVLEGLERKGLILIDQSGRGFLPFECNTVNDITFSVPFSTVDMLRRGEFQSGFRIDNLTIENFFIQLERLCEKRVQRMLPYERSIQDMNVLLDSNTHLGFVEKVKALGLGDDETFILLRFFHYTVTNDKQEMGYRELVALYDHASEFTPMWRSLKNGSHILLCRELIENAHAGGFSDAESFCLTDKTRNEFLEELDIDFTKKSSAKRIMSYNSIAEKPLYYPEKTERMIKELTLLLAHENFQNIRKRLAQGAMRTGFACLFSGGPGTGKTETAYQIARKTGRDLMIVDIAGTKSKWFGESEKRIKELFDCYRSCVKSYDQAGTAVPILLFNEADALIGKRRILGENRNGPDQTENAIQNIILEEIEKLNGILIATTNLNQNMDSAFERRFLYKIEFEKPSVSACKLIWQSMIGDLSDRNAEELAVRFDFSGGQIENIARRMTVDTVLHNSPPEFSKLISYCEDEYKDKTAGRRIGFAV